MSGTFSWYVITLPSLVVIGVVIVEVFLICRVIKQEHRIKESGDYNDRGS